MSRYEWLYVGLKLLGVYFGVSGLVALWTVLLTMTAMGGSMAKAGMDASALQVAGLLAPAMQLAAAVLLVWRTHTCLRWCGEQEHRRSE